MEFMFEELMIWRELDVKKIGPFVCLSSSIFLLRDWHTSYLRDNNSKHNSVLFGF